MAIFRVVPVHNTENKIIPMPVLLIPVPVLELELELEQTMILFSSKLETIKKFYYILEMELVIIVQ